MEQESRKPEMLAGSRRRSRRSDDTKEQIIASAARVLAKSGYESTSLEDVAAAAGVTKGTLYYHFDSKEAIYAAVLHHYLGDALHALRAADTPGRPPLEVIEAVIDDQLIDTMRPETRYIHYQDYSALATERSQWYATHKGSKKRPSLLSWSEASATVW